MGNLLEMENLTRKRKSTREAVESAIDRAKLDSRATWYSLLSRPAVHVKPQPKEAKKVVKKKA
jgi:hypothetical protein